MDDPPGHGQSVDSCGLDASLLAQQLDDMLASSYSLWVDARVCLAYIPSLDEALRNLGTFAFAAADAAAAAAAAAVASSASAASPTDKTRQRHGQERSYIPPTLLIEEDGLQQEGHCLLGHTYSL